MFAFTARPKLLLKLSGSKKPKSARGKLTLAGGKVNFNIDLNPMTTPTNARQKGAWWTAEVDQADFGADGANVNAWDLCYDIMRRDAKISGADIEFAEPDLEQSWLLNDPAGRDFGFSGARDPDGEVAGQDTSYNTAEPNHWFRNARHSQLDQARRKVGSVSDEDRVRIAQFDTGFDPNHATIPAHLDLELAKNFVDPGRPNDATDRSEGRFAQVGHGTGTLGILAGSAWGDEETSRLPLGGAPFAHVVPVRVANSVVLFRTSAIAQAFNYVTQLSKDPATRVDVVTMSMGGLASQAWADAVNLAYDAGIFIVTAAGNNFGGVPTRFLVYPARFNRVVAACGVQARVDKNLLPYADLPIRLMAGNYGPESQMGEAMAAFTPNVPWARIHSGDKVDFDGGGTSSATPQIAAAAAIWMQSNREALDRYSEPWMRVEATRNALFSSALKKDVDPSDNVRFFGQGVLQANSALKIKPARANILKRADEDNASLALIRGLAGLGLAETKRTSQDRMLELELLQATQTYRELAEFAGGMNDLSDQKKLEAFREAVAEQEGLSTRVHDWLEAGAGQRPTVKAARGRGQPPQTAPASSFLRRQRLKHAKQPDVSKPAMRKLQVYSSDPSAVATTADKPYAVTTISLPWQNLKPGPIDEYFEVVDFDPTSGAFYAPVDLDHKHLLATDGMEPSESDPRFHQQMVYAVARTTVRHFEEALGRPALWAPRRVRYGRELAEQFVRRLRIYPHALREQNAYYSPDKKALLFGYFSEGDSVEGGVAPGSTVFTCLSYDVVAHETAHALLDGLHRRYAEISNADNRAFHEAFSDLIALFQHFTHEDVLLNSIARAQGVDFDTGLTNLATQFGRSSGERGALRSALGLQRDSATQEPVRVTLDQVSNSPHARGAILVAAMFDAFLDIYRRRSADLIRIATNGTGVLPDGQIHPDLVNRLGREAAKTARHLLRIAIRALDYCPATSITFGEYLRALITSDFDMFPEDVYDYRTAFVSAFRGRGIHPEGVQTVSADSLRWYPPEVGPEVHAIIGELIDAADNSKLFRNWKLETERRETYELSRALGAHFNRGLRRKFSERGKIGHDEAARLGFVLDHANHRVELKEGSRTITGRLRPFEVHSVRPARRITAAGQERLDVVVEISQSLRLTGESTSYRGGSTWIVDADSGQMRYCVRKRVDNVARVAAERGFRDQTRRSERGNYYRQGVNAAEPFALNHRGQAEIEQ